MLFPPVWENHKSQQPLPPLLGPKCVSVFLIPSSSLKIAAGLVQGIYTICQESTESRGQGLSPLHPFHSTGPSVAQVAYGLLRFHRWLKQPTSTQGYMAGTRRTGHAASLRASCQLFLFACLCSLKHPQQATWDGSGVFLLSCLSSIAQAHLPKDDMCQHGLNLPISIYMM